MYSSLSLFSFGFMLILSVAHAATVTSIRGTATSLPHACRSIGNDVPHFTFTLPFVLLGLSLRLSLHLLSSVLFSGLVFIFLLRLRLILILFLFLCAAVAIGPASTSSKYRGCDKEYSRSGKTSQRSRGGGAAADADAGAARLRGPRGRVARGLLAAARRRAPVSCALCALLRDRMMCVRVCTTTRVVSCCVLCVVVCRRDMMRYIYIYIK
jgi:hypothetical protein